MNKLKSKARQLRLALRIRRKAKVSELNDASDVETTSAPPASEKVELLNARLQFPCLVMDDRQRDVSQSLPQSLPVEPC